MLAQPAGGTKRLLTFCACGTAAGLIVFAAESVVVFQASRAMLDADGSGVGGAALVAVRPAVTHLLLRIAAAYAAAGAALGLMGGALAQDASRTRRGFRLLWAFDSVAIALCAAWAACIQRPGLFEDVETLRPAVRWIALHGYPWQPSAAAALLFALHVPRSRRRFRTALRGAAALAVAFLPAIRLPTPRLAPGSLFVLIGLDAFRPDRIEGDALARHLAPNLERFLADAVRFDRAYTPIAQTEPAWAALLTARWPPSTGVRHPLTADVRRAPLQTFAAAFSAAGFHTTFATDCSRFNWQGPGAGFEQRFQPPRGAVNFVLEKLRYRALGVFGANAVGRFWLPEIFENRALPGFYDPSGYAQRLAARLGEEARSWPALFAFHGTVIHYPGDVAYPFYQAYPDAPLRMSYSVPGSGPPSHESRAQREELYDELVSEADAQLGILLDRLRAEGRYDDAVIVVFSDHGEGFEPGFPEMTPEVPVHGVQLSDDENRILLAIKPPAGTGVAVGRTDHHLVRLIDLGPTLLEAARLPLLRGADGTSLLPLLRGDSMPPLFLYAETGYTHVAPDAFDARHFSSGVRGLDAYRVRADGAVEMNARAHDLAMREKDVGAFDGEGWLVRAPQADGSTRESCVGTCSAELRAWLANVQTRGTGARADAAW